jgi:hypothetical protein
MTTEPTGDVKRLAHALWVWDAVELELGDLAIITGNSVTAGMIAKVACWRSGGSVIALDRFPGTGSAWHPGETIDASDQAATLQRLGAAIAAAPSTAAAICDGDAAILELVLEALPAWGRVVLATESTQPATVDFYNNVHRKGCRIVTVPATPAQLDDETWRRLAEPHLERAIRISRLRPSLISETK